MDVAHQMFLDDVRSNELIGVPHQLIDTSMRQGDLAIRKVDDDTMIVNVVKFTTTTEDLFERVFDCIVWIMREHEASPFAE